MKKAPTKMAKKSPAKNKMKMVKGPDGKMVPDFAVDGKGKNDMAATKMKKAAMKMKKASAMKMKKMKDSAATMKKAAMKLKKESAMKLKKSGMMMKKAAMTMKKASAMKLKMENPPTPTSKTFASKKMTIKQKKEALKRYKAKTKKK